MRFTEAEIQSLKAQEAKDAAVDLLRELEEKEKGPISPGEVQLRELEYELKLKEADQQDRREREAHERLIRELELKIEQERSRQQGAAQRADEVRRQYAEMIERTRTAEEALSVKLDRATREHNWKLEQLETEYGARIGQLTSEQQTLEERCAALRDEIQQLADLQDVAAEIDELQRQLHSKRASLQHELLTLDDQLSHQEHEKAKKIDAVRRAHELELTRLETEHAKSVLLANRAAADKILAELGLIAIDQVTFDKLREEAERQRTITEQELESVRHQAEDEIRRRYNITSAEPADVTSLFYEHRSLQQELRSLQELARKQETEIQRMRQHIEQEPTRISTAVEAAKVHVQNRIEPGRKM